MDAAGDAPGKEKSSTAADDATIDGADQAKLANGLSGPTSDSGEDKKTS